VQSTNRLVRGGFPGTRGTPCTRSAGVLPGLGGRLKLMYFRASYLHINFDLSPKGVLFPRNPSIIPHCVCVCVCVCVCCGLVWTVLGVRVGVRHPRGYLPTFRPSSGHACADPMFPEYFKGSPFEGLPGRPRLGHPSEKFIYSEDFSNQIFSEGCPPAGHAKRCAAEPPYFRYKERGMGARFAGHYRGKPFLVSDGA